MVKKQWLTMVVLIIFLITIGGCTGTPTNVELLCGSTTAKSSHYVAAVTQAEIINNHVPGVNIRVVETGASYDNILKVQKGELDMATVTTTDALSQAYYSELKFEGKDPWKDARSMWMYQSACTIAVVRADSGVTKLEELDGKEFACGSIGSATEFIWMTTFDALGIHPKFFKGSSSDQVAAMKNRRIAGFGRACIGIQLGSRVQDVMTSGPVRILGFTDEQLETVLEALPGLFRVDVPAGALTAFPECPAYSTLGYLATTFSTPEISEDIGYEMVKAIDTYWESEMLVGFPASKGVQPVLDIVDVLGKMGKPIPLHAGTVKYLKEQGGEVPQKLVPPEYKG